MSKKKRDCVLLLGVTVESTGIGGVTVHTSRLCQWLSKRGYPYDFCDYKHTSIWTQVKEISRHPLVHIHANNPKATLFWVLVGKITGTKTILTIHGNLGHLSRINNFLRRLSVTICDTPILLNNRCYNIALKWNPHSVLMPAFILPLDDGEIPDEVEMKIKSEKEKGVTIVATNAHQRAIGNQGEEIYGIGFLVNYFKGNNKYLLCISNPSGQYAQEYADKHYDNILFISVPHSFFRLLKLSDIMVRATSTDGDSLSVKEALTLQKKVIATDCVDRPEGVVLFKYDDAESLSKALNTDVKPSQMEYDDVVGSLMKLYDKMLRN